MERRDIFILYDLISKILQLKQAIRVRTHQLTLFFSFFAHILFAHTFFLFDWARFSRGRLSRYPALQQNLCYIWAYQTFQEKKKISLQIFRGSGKVVIPGSKRRINLTFLRSKRY